MSNPRIYIAIATFHPMIGGAEIRALTQGRSLRERGYEATIITFRHDRTWLPSEAIKGVPVIRVAGRLLGGRERLPRLFQKLLYLLALVVMGWTLWRHRRGYDILHVYQLTLFALPTVLVCWLTSKPVIIAVCCSSSGKRAKPGNNVSLNAGPLDATASWLQVHEHNLLDGDLANLERLGKPVVRFTRLLFRRVHAVVVILSTRMKDYLVAHDFNLPGIQLIPSGVDISRFHPARGDTASDERAQVVICIARLSYQKGIDVLLQAWYLVHEQAPQAQLIIVGDGPIRDQLQSMARALDIANSVEFAGVQSDVVAHLHRSNLLVLPSRWEGMPNVVLEAMACSLPCVVTRVSGSEDLIQHGINGLLVESEDYQGMAQALLTLLRDAALAQEYGNVARATIEQRYSLEHVIDIYAELYQRIADHRGPIAKDTPPSKIYHVPS